MKTLEARKKARQKQREAEYKERVGEPVQGEDESEQTETKQPDLLKLSVEKFKDELAALTLEQLAELEKSEFGESGKKRTGIKDALEAERAKRKSTAGGWNSNAG